MLKRNLMAILGCGLLIVGAADASACTSATMAKTDTGFVKKVVAGSDQIFAYADAAEKSEAFKLELLQPYFVICETGSHYRITNVHALTVEEAEAATTGFVHRDQIYEWPTREALDFGPMARVAGRPEAVAWDDRSVLKSFMESGNSSLHPPAFKENIEATLARERTTRPYPVLGSANELLMGQPKRVYNVLVPTAIRPTDDIVIEPGQEEKLEAALTSASIVVVFDATGSMAPFAQETASALERALTSLPTEVRENSRMGFVFYRDVGDAEDLVAMPLMSLAEAAQLLKRVATPSVMTGGGDDAEPVLDAVYYANHLYDWGSGQGGRRIIVAVLNDDAKPTTIGNLKGARGKIPAGLNAMSVAAEVAAKSTPLITVQAGPNRGPRLDEVLGTLAEQARSRFLRWGEAGLSPTEVSEALTAQMTGEARKAIDDGGIALGYMQYDANNFATIPLEVLDGEKLERLRNAGIRFNISRADGGVLIQEAYMLENTDLLEPRINIEKATLDALINLYSVLSVSGVDTDSMRSAIMEAVAAIAGEDFDPGATLQDIVSKQLGIQFRSELLNFNLEFLESMLPAERNSFAKRIQDAARSLTQFREANLEEFDNQPAVWMPVARLP